MASGVSGATGSDRGFTMPGNRPTYKNYRSPFGPKYTVQPNFHGVTAVTLTRLGLGLGMFGGVAGIAAIFFLSDVPRVRVDIMQKLPFIGHRYVKVIPPEDNPF